MAFDPVPAIPPRGARIAFSNAVNAFVQWITALPAQLELFLARLETLAAGGAYAIPLTVDATTGADADPGAGKVRFDVVANQLGAAVLYINLVGANGTSYAAQYAEYTRSTSAIKGTIRIQKTKDPAAFVVYNVTGTTAAGGYMKIAITPLTGSAAKPFATGDSVMLFFQPNGDKGAVGNADKKVQTAGAPVAGVLTVDYRDGNCLVWSPAASSTTSLKITNWPTAGTLGEFWIAGVNLGAATVNMDTAINWLRPDGTYNSSTSINTNHGATLRTTGEDNVLLWGRSGAPEKGKVAR